MLGDETDKLMEVENKGKNKEYNCKKDRRTLLISWEYTEGKLGRKTMIARIVLPLYLLFDALELRYGPFLISLLICWIVG